MSDIKEFQGEYRWLSNFWPVEVVFDFITYPSIEHAYQAAKTRNIVAREAFRNCTAGEAKRMGRTLNIREDWEAVKLVVMEGLLRQKFLTPHFREKLLATGDCQIIEGNKWGDTFWGVCRGKGENHLGKLIMGIREELRMTTNPHADGEG